MTGVSKKLPWVVAEVRGLYHKQANKALYATKRHNRQSTSNLFAVTNYGCYENRSTFVVINESILLRPGLSTHSMIVIVQN